jgi:hypothetical protein
VRAKGCRARQRCAKFAAMPTLTLESDETFQAWQRSAARVTLHPAWPVPITLNVVSLGSVIVELQCIVHAYNASDVLVDLPLVPWKDLPMMDVRFSQVSPIIEALDRFDCEVARLQYVRTRIHQAVLHELDEFLLVDGHVAASPHEPRPAFMPMPSVKYGEISTWHVAIARISLHPAFGLQLDLGVEEDLQGRAMLSCTVRHSDPGLAVAVRNTASARENACYVQQLLALVQHAVQRLLDECLLVDGILEARLLEEAFILDECLLVDGILEARLLEAAFQDRGIPRNVIP